ncbi:hypothetical protein D7Z26_11525 [Cohnella endophytica]|uniref:Uncharacterized protein n=1 Tax=Cohnella endophytica TaxID=2419778 RepID=A0A494Y0Y9_9BACL|nr:DUF2161 family putative PD-(D/E)XK-type phosphodiesterase [Cohnella endophytica]RKP54012.1 hypothetical protein D7Z26_11525 [Cohnella endophytica]
MAVKLETELYPPVKGFFEERGYEVKAEIRGCDLVAYRADRTDPIIVEMKKTFTLPLLLQGADRQKTGAEVWLAVERNRTKKGAHNQRFAEIAALCRRLNLGFLTITFYRTKKPVIDVWCEPVSSHAGTASPIASERLTPYSVAPIPGGRKKAKAAKLMQEFNARSGDYNVGGSTKRKLITAYRERAIQCALALDCHGPSAPRTVRDLTHCPTAASMLRSNYYGWFARVAKGIYDLTPAGRSALGEYAGVTQVWAKQFPWAEKYVQRELETEPEGVMV